MDFTGNIFWRGDAGYEAARVGRVFNHRRPERYPAAVFFPTNEKDVVAAVQFANEKNYKIAIRAGGHSWAAWSVRDEGILLDLQHLNEIALDQETGIVRVQPAVKGGAELNPFLKPYGLMFNGGHCPSVGVGGYILQGGQGWCARGWGWSAEQIVAIEVVTAAGELVRADATQNSDLYWAARGAGPGFFGVVTCFHLRTRPIPPAIFASVFIYPAQYGAEVLQWLQETHGDMHPHIEIVSVGQFLPQIEGVEGSNIPVQIVHGMAFAETEAAAAQMLAPLRACPLLKKAYFYKTCYPTSVEQEVKEQIRMNPEGHRWAVNNAWLQGSPQEVAPLIASSFSQLPTLKTFTLWYSMAPLRPLPDMAFSLQTDIYMALYAIWEDEADDERCKNWLKAQMQRIEPVTAGQYLGDSDFIHFPRRFMADANFERLQHIRALRDPQGRFHSYLSNPGTVLNQNPWMAAEPETQHPKSEILKAHHVGISVANLAESVEWYTEKLGFKLQWTKDFPPIQTKIAFLKQGDFQIELFEHHETKPLPENRRNPLTDIQVQGTKHICFQAEDLKTLYEKLEKQGVDIAMSLRRSPPGDADMCFVRDPTGNLIEIIQLI